MTDRAGDASRRRGLGRPRSSRFRLFEGLCCLAFVGSAAAESFAGAAEATDAAAFAGQANPAIATELTAITPAAGTPLFAEPSVAARELLRFEEAVTLVPIEIREAWARVRWSGVVGWVAIDGSGAIEPRGRVDPERWRAAVEALVAERRTERAAGDLALATDLASAREVEALAAFAAAFPAAHAARLGLAPVPMSGAALAVFSERAGYFAFRDRDRAAAPVSARGHAGGGLAALVGSPGDLGATRAIVAHELAHLVQARLFPRGLPFWLEEGAAEDAATACYRPDLARIETCVAGEAVVSAAEHAGAITIDLVGARAELSRIAQSARQGRLRSIGEVVELPWWELDRVEARAETYAFLGFFVRFLFAESGAELRAALGEFAQGETPNAEERLARLLAQPDLESRFGDWLSGLDAGLARLDRSVRRPQP